MKEVDITLTQTFFFVAQEGTYSAAARRLNITYQSVANHIRRLEQRVGEKLVVARRGAKSIKLTARGTSLYRLLAPEFDVMLTRLGSLIDKQRPVVRIGRIARQPADHDLIEPAFAQYRNAVEAFLPVHRQVVAELLEKDGGKGLVAGLDLLEAGDVRIGLLEPGEGAVEPGLGAIDVPGRDAHAPFAH